MSNGIIELTLSDPLSQLMNKILGHSITNINAVGFYFNYNDNDADICIYRIYDNIQVNWIPHKLNQLLTCAYIDKIIMYDVIVDKFVKKAKHIINNNINNNYNYDDLLLSIFNIKNYNDIITGYTLINRCFVKYNYVSNRKYVNGVFNEIKNITPEPITPTELFFHSVVQYIRKDIVNLLGSFANLYINNYDFRNAVLTGNISNKNIKNKIYKNLKTNYLVSLGNKLRELIKIFKTNTSYILDLGNIIHLYNNLSSKIEPVHYEHLVNKKKYGTSRNITIILNHESSPDLILVNDQFNLIVPLYNPNLIDLSNPELLELLIYIDQLEDKSYVRLQNLIVKELANRNTNK